MLLRLWICAAGLSPSPSPSAPAPLRGSGFVGRVRLLPALERSVRGTHVCRWGLPVAGGQSKGRPLVGGNKARDDGPPAALVFSASCFL